MIRTKLVAISTCLLFATTALISCGKSDDKEKPATTTPAAEGEKETKPTPDEPAKPVAPPEPEEAMIPTEEDFEEVATAEVTLKNLEDEIKALEEELAE